MALGSVGADDDESGAMRVMRMTLPQHEKSALTQLSVFPSSFDDKSASMVMVVDEFRAPDLIKACV